MLPWFDTLMGLVVILLAVSLIVMVLVQIITGIVNLRGLKLRKGIAILLENTDEHLKRYAEKISHEALGHPLISDTSIDFLDWNLASTIRSGELRNILDKLSKSGGEEWQKALRAHMPKIEENIEMWFDKTMDRVTQYFVSHTRFLTIVLSIIIAFALHLDLFQVFNKISTNAELRTSLSHSANTILTLSEDVANTANQAVPANSEEIAALHAKAKKLKGELDKTGFDLIPANYPSCSEECGTLKHSIGVLLMAALLSLGAPFWFNALKGMSSLRPILAGKEDAERKARNGTQ